jgi:TfoX/Sxy family transcriptional regulator of competence genes
MTDLQGPRHAKSDAAAKEEFRALVPDDPRVTVRPMFGSVAAFVEGQMFMGLFADDLFVRLGADERAQVIANGGAQLEPMPGRPMREYVTLPDWRSDPDVVARWAPRALDYAAALPPKKSR